MRLGAPLLGGAFYTFDGSCSERSEMIGIVQKMTKIGQEMVKISLKRGDVRFSTPFPSSYRARNMTIVILFKKRLQRNSNDPKRTRIERDIASGDLGLVAPFGGRIIAFSVRLNSGKSFI